MTTAARPTFDPARGYDAEKRRIEAATLDKDDSDDDSDEDSDNSIKEFDKLEADERQRQEEALAGNPILIKVFSVKRRWDDDVIFKNQARGVDDRSKKRFINDTLRSDPIVQQRNSGEMEKGQSARARLG
ncbi:16152_t:CDS:2, partial [Funneliformis geosporum]